MNEAGWQRRCAWFYKLTMREMVGLQWSQERAGLVTIGAILNLPHGELVEPRTAALLSTNRQPRTKWPDSDKGVAKKGLNLGQLPEINHHPLPQEPLSPTYGANSCP